MSDQMKVAICGAGAWGTAMAIQCAQQGLVVSLLPRRKEQAEAMRRTGENQAYLPGYPLPKGLSVETSDEAALSDASIVLLGSPSYALRLWLERIKKTITADRRVFFISLAKGLELNSGKTPCDLSGEVFPEHLMGCLSGPTFAGEVAEGKPVAMTLAASAIEPIVEATQMAISGPNMRIYLSEDLRGVELGGCLKNVYAVAAGCSQGLSLGDNAQAALLTRALAEMVRVGLALGARSETFYGLSGFGDLSATCHGEWSRNRTFGEAVAKGRSAKQVVESQKTAVEGYRTAKSFHKMLSAKGIDAPILEQVYRILYDDKRPMDALSDLMSRDLKHEND